MSSGRARSRRNRPLCDDKRHVWPRSYESGRLSPACLRGGASRSFERAVKLNKSPAFILQQFGLTGDNVAEKAKAI